MNAEQLLTHFDRIADAPDAIPRLRRFILDLAVRGKLVEQDPNDEPASELLKRIKQTRDERHKRKLALIGSDPTKTDFDLPDNWDLAPLSALGDWAIGAGFPKSEQGRTEGPYFFLKVSDMNLPGNEKVIVTAQNRIDNEVAARIRVKIHSVRTIIFPKIGGAIATNKRRILGRPSAIDNNCLGITISSEINLNWAYLLLTSLDFTKYQVGTAVPALQQGVLERIPVGIPPLAEQHRITAKVDELMALCDRLETARKDREKTLNRLTAASLTRLNTPDPDPAVFQNHAAFTLDNLAPLTTRPGQIKALRQTILNLAVRGKLVPQDPSDEPASELLKREKSAVPSTGPFELPASWAWANVGTVADSRLGKMLDKAKNKGTPRRYLRNINVRWFDFDLSDLLEMRFEDSELPEFALRFGDVMICEGGEPGRAAVWDDRETDIYFQKAIHRVRFLDFIDSEFFVKALRASADDGRLAEYFTGTGIKHFTGKGLAAYLFPIPPLAEQHRIVAKVNELMELGDRLETSLAAGDDSRRHMLDTLLHEVLHRDRGNASLSGIGGRSNRGEND